MLTDRDKLEIIESIIVFYYEGVITEKAPESFGAGTINAIHAVVLSDWYRKEAKPNE
jgi:hypothetical protein